MIPVTDEMRAAFRAERDDWCDEIGCGRDDCLTDRLAAVLAIVERDLDPTTVGTAAATAKLYSLAVLDEVNGAVGKLHAELDDIKRRYKRELSTGPDQFRALIAMGERIEP